MSACESNGIKKHVWGAAGTIAAALIVQIFGLVWWAGQIDARMTRVERDVQDVAQRVHAVEVRPPRP